MRTINELIIHCSASNNNTYGVEEIRADHKSRGWNDIGYHFFIDYSGKLFFGRSIEKAGAHCKGFNAHSIGICLAGLNNFTQRQYETLRDLCDMLLYAFDLEKDAIVPHNKYNKYKTCPNFDIDVWNESLKE